MSAKLRELAKVWAPILSLASGSKFHVDRGISFEAGSEALSFGAEGPLTVVVRSGAGLFACCSIRGRWVGLKEAATLLPFVVFDGSVPYIAILAGACDAQACLLKVAIQAAAGR